MKKKQIASMMIAAMSVAVVPQTTFAEVGGVITRMPTEEVVEGVGAYVQTKEKATQLAETAVSMLGLPSVQYALIIDGELILSENRAVDGMTTDTLYGIGSVSKMYTTAAMMKLVEMGKVDLDKPVTTYIPQFRMDDARYKDITVRMLLNHSSGIMGSTLRGGFLFETADTMAHDELLQQLATQRLKADPGAYSVYCNDGFTLAELVIEAASGVSYTTFITEQILTPLGLENTKTPENLKDLSTLAVSYDANGARPKEITNVIGTGGIYATAEDLARFGTIFTGETAILGDTSLAAMATNEAANGRWIVEEDNCIDYGLGWDSVNLYPFNQYGTQALVKGGDTTSYHGSLIVLPEENMSVAVLTSAGSSTIDSMIGATILESALLEKGVITETVAPKNFGVPVATPIAEEVMDYTGYYAGLGTCHVEMEQETGKLKYSLVGASAVQEFIHVGEGIFVSEDGSTQLTFVEEKEGTYIYVRGYATLPGFVQSATGVYQAQKLPTHKVGTTVERIWKDRVANTYLIVNEPHNSVTYSIGGLMASLYMNDATPGYMDAYKIVNANKAVAFAQIPGMMGRDQSDLKFFKKDGVEYLGMGAYIGISSAAIETLIGETSYTVGKDGYAKWYHIGEEVAGKTITVTLPENASVAIYNEFGMCTYSTLTATDTTAVLPTGGKIVCAGKVGSEIVLNID